MGGFGSTRWNDHHRAVPVEECICLDANSFRQNWRTGRPDTSGTLVWQGAGGGVQGSAPYSVRFGFSHGKLILRYTARSHQVNQNVELAPTRPHYGGRRWWFRCPRCGRRVRKLFLPPGDFSFECRQCHRLTYRSSAESHTCVGEFRRLCRLGLFRLH